MKQSNSNINYEKELEKCVKLYNAVGLKTRNMSFFTQWIFDVYNNLSWLPCTDASYRSRLAIDKSRLSVFSILIDDLADNVKIRNKELLDVALKLPRNLEIQSEDKYLQTAIMIWNLAHESIKAYPRFSDFKHIFYHDIAYFMNSMDYGYLVNNYNMGNILETRIHSPDNMMIKPFLCMDLMCSPTFDIDELGKVRPLFYYTQDICHIGNILSTWQREIIEQDFSSPLISYALNKNLITKDYIINYPEESIKKLKKLETVFLARAEKDFKEISKTRNKIKTVDVNKFSETLRQAFVRFQQRAQYWKLASTLPKK